MTHHLLPSRNPEWSHYKEHFLAAEPYLERRRFPTEIDRIDLFTDGSCWMPQIPEFSLGAWAVVCPQLDQWVVRGTLTGLLQHNDIAELKAIKEALEWTAGFRGEVTLWSDSSYAASGLVRLLGNSSDLPEDLGGGLWVEIQELVNQRTAMLRVQHVAAHRTELYEADPVDAWTAKWNARADWEAASAQYLRPQDFLNCRNRLLAHHREGCELLGQLQALHLDISEHRLANPEVDEEEDPSDLTLRVWWEQRCWEADGSWIGQIDDQWPGTLPGSTLAQKFGLLFPRRMISWICEQSQAVDVQTMKWTFLELAIYWLKRLPDQLPVPSSCGSWTDGVSSNSRGRVSPTVAATVFLFRRFFSCLPDFLGVPIAQCRNISLLPFDVHTPQIGVHLTLSKEVITDTHSTLRDFVRHRPIRVVNDLSRPLR
eukprot:s3975_g4.t1